MTIVRAQVTLPWTTGLPEDITVNTFHFFTEDSPPDTTQLDTIETQLVAFYNVASGVAGDAIGGFLSTLLSRVANACTIKYYDLEDAEPRAPLRTDTFTLIAQDSATSMPAEVSLCLSFQGVKASGIPQARRRGRVYVGPFIRAATVLTDSTGRPTSALTASVADAGNAMHDALNVGASAVRWVVYSPKTDAEGGTPTDASIVVDNGWCDDEWDILRSRGRRPTVRATFQ